MAVLVAKICARLLAVLLIVNWTARNVGAGAVARANLLPTDADHDFNEKKLPTIERAVQAGKTANFTIPLGLQTKERYPMMDIFRVQNLKPINFSNPTVRIDLREHDRHQHENEGTAADFAHRVHAEWAGELLVLLIRNVETSDKGVYIFHAWFFNSPIQKFRLALRVYVLPYEVRMSYGPMGEVLSNNNRPVEIGDVIHAQCTILGGFPKPKNVEWTFGSANLTEHRIVTETELALVSRLTLGPLKRHDNNVELRCAVKVDPEATAVGRRTRLRMFLPPIAVMLNTSSNETVEEGTNMTITCMAVGSVPPAQLSWWRNGVPYDRKEYEILTNGTRSYAWLRLSFNPSDDGAKYSCQANNRELRRLFDKHKASVDISVLYTPKAEINLGRALKLFEVVQGDSIYLECLYKANPRVDRILWLFNDQVLPPKIASTASLVIRNVTREDAGSYACRVRSPRGETTSRKLLLPVQHAPVCALSVAMAVVGVRLDESVRLRCEVDAHPSDVMFKWEFKNTTGQNFSMSLGRVVFTNETTSIAEIFVASERDLGVVSCRAKNAVGDQADPCVFRIVPASLPEAPRNCSWAFSYDETYLAVKCTGNYDYSMPLHHNLEVIGKRNRTLVTSTDSFPRLFEYNGTVRVVGRRGAPTTSKDVWLNISATALQLYKGESLAVTAHNPIGASAPTILKNFVWSKVIEDPDILAALEKERNRKILFSVSIFALVFIVVYLGIYIYCKWKQRAPPAEIPMRRLSSVVEVDRYGQPHVSPVRPDDTQLESAVPPPGDRSSQPRISPVRAESVVQLDHHGQPRVSPVRPDDAQLHSAVQLDGRRQPRIPPVRADASPDLQTVVQLDRRGQPRVSPVRPGGAQLESAVPVDRRRPRRPRILPVRPGDSHDSVAHARRNGRLRVVRFDRDAEAAGAATSSNIDPPACVDVCAGADEYNGHEPISPAPQSATARVAAPRACVEVCDHKQSPASPWQTAKITAALLPPEEPNSAHQSMLMESNEDGNQRLAALQNKAEFIESLLASLPPLREEYELGRVRRRRDDSSRRNSQNINPNDWPE